LGREIGGIAGCPQRGERTAVAAFLEKRCFPSIWQTVERTMREHTPVAHPDLAAILAADSWARERAAERL
jgi:1-deoxy-D-xylulose-5-phosphate reductoisomerase